jgi:hypothetical protein
VGTKDDERWDARLENWALWKIGGVSTGIGSAYDGEWGGGAPRLPIALVGEALDTDDLVLKLADHLQRALEAAYCWIGTDGMKAHQLSCHRDTFADRVRLAKERLEVLWWLRHRQKSKSAPLSPQKA